MADVKIEFRDGWESDLAKQVGANVANKLRSVTCPTHGQAPTVVVKGRTLDELGFEVRGCCQQLVDKALAQLR
jgi:hypothetical protein